MIESIIGLSGTALVGAILGEFSNARAKNQATETQKHELECLRISKENGQMQSYLKFLHNRKDNSRPDFGWVIGVFGVTICAAIIFGCCFPTAPIITFNPGSDPTTIDLFFFKFSYGADKTYEITLGGMAYALCYPLVGILGATLTGIAPGRRFK